MFVEDAGLASSDANESAASADELLRLTADNSRLIQQQPQCESSMMMMSRHSLGGDSTVQLDFIHAQQELSRCKEALIGLLLPIQYTCISFQ